MTASPSMPADAVLGSSAPGQTNESVPELLVERANLPRTANKLAAHLAKSRRFFVRGSEVVRSVARAGAPLGSFEQRASWCRDPLLELGSRDPVTRIEELKFEDPRRQEISEFFIAWHDAHCSKPVQFKALDP